LANSLPPNYQGFFLDAAVSVGLVYLRHNELFNWRFLLALSFSSIVAAAQHICDPRSNGVAAL
jgi:hypothetical protein